MFVSTATLNKPTTILTYFPELKPRKSILHSKLTTLELISCREFVYKKLVFSGKRGRSLITMAESIITDVCRESNGDEGIGALEQEVSIDDSNEFHPNFAAGGLESTLNHLSKWLVIAFFYTVILLRHDTKALWLVLGAHLNGGLSITLKQILNQERPFSTLKSDPGMPSSHAQSIFFSVFVANLSIMEWLGVNGLATTLAGFLLALGSYFSWLRVSQQFHTVSQVVVGALVGSMFAILWFWLWEAIVLKAFISYLWVRFSVAFGGAVISLGFTLYIFRYWVMDEK